MRFKIGDYGYWDSNGRSLYRDKRVIIFKVYDIGKHNYICEALYDNKCHYPRKDVYFPINTDTEYKKMSKEKAEERVMVESI